MSRKPILLPVVCLACIASLAWAGGATEKKPAAAAASSPNQTSVLQIEVSSLGDMLPPVWADYANIWRDMMFDRLMSEDVKGAPVYYELAKSHTVSADGLTYTFLLKDGIQWHDGVPFTPEDYVWSVKTAIRSAKIGGLFAGAFGSLQGAKEYKEKTSEDFPGISVSGNSIVFKLATLNNTFMDAVASFPPLPKHLLSNENPLTIHQAAFWKNPIGTGAYKMAEFVPNQYMILKRFADYYGPKHLIETVKGIPATGDTQVARALAGDVDYIYCIAAASAAEIQKDPKFTMTTIDVSYNRFLRANLMGYGKDAKGNPKIADARIRKALLLAIDRQKLVDTIFKGKAIVANSFVSPTSRFYNKDANQFTYDVEKAKQLLKDAQFDFSQKLVIGQFYGDPQTMDVCETIKSYWQALGIQVEINSMAAGTDAVTYVYESKPFDFIYAGGGGPVPVNNYAICVSSNQYGAKVFGTAGKVYDDLVAEAYKTVDDAKSIEIAKKLQAVEEQTMFHMQLFTVPNFVFVNKEKLRTAGVYGNQNLHINLFLEKWELLK